MRKLMIVSVVLASLAAAPVAAQAQAGSGVDQYQENIPGAGGNHPDGSNGGHNGGNAGGGHQGGGGGAAGGGSGGGGSAGGGNSLSPQVTDELNAQGADGAATAAIADSTAPQGSGSGSNGGGNGHSGGSGNGGSGSGGSGSSNTTLQSDDGGGAGSAAWSTRSSAATPRARTAWAWPCRSSCSPPGWARLRSSSSPGGADRTSPETCEHRRLGKRPRPRWSRPSAFSGGALSFRNPSCRAQSRARRRSFFCRGSKRKRPARSDQRSRWLAETFESP